MSRDADDKVKPITRAELEGMSHGDLAKVKTKRRILAALPSEDDGDEDGGGGGGGGDDDALDVQSTNERLRRAIVKEEEARNGD